MSGNVKGVELGFNFWSRSIIHLHLTTYYGLAVLTTSGGSLDEPVDNHFRGGEVETQIEVNVTDNIRLGTGVGYRFGKGDATNFVKAEDLSGPTFGVFFKLIYL